MANNLFGIANVKQLRSGGSFKILLPYLGFVPRLSQLPYTPSRRVLWQTYLWLFVSSTTGKISAKHTEH